MLPKTRGRPRRPKTVKVPFNVDIHGVAECPDDEQNFVEFMYQTPSVMRKRITILRTYYAHVITFDFTTDSLIVTASDHTGRVPILVNLIAATFLIIIVANLVRCQRGAFI